MRDALPNASFIGFTGTPIERADANTRSVFGDHISIYDIRSSSRLFTPVFLGRNWSAELSSPEYRFLDSDVKGNVTQLSKGELLLSHAVYHQPIKINFPMPIYKQSR